jgi:hypothetical protein
MNQAEKLAARLKKLLEETGLHEIKVYVSPEKEIVFWIVETKKTEGLPKETEKGV